MNPIKDLYQTVKTVLKDDFDETVRRHPTIATYVIQLFNTESKGILPLRNNVEFDPISNLYTFQEEQPDGKMKVTHWEQICIEGGKWGVKTPEGFHDFARQ